MSEKNISILNLEDILPNRFQPRIYFNDRQINELADSIKEHGVIQPIVVRKISDKYEIIAGERRYKASKLAGKITIPAIIVNLSDKESAELALIENVQRQNLTPIEESISYKKILDMGYLTQTELAEKLGRTQSTIANKLRLLNLDDEVQEALMNGKISERHARSLLKLNKNNQKPMLDRIVNERLTVRKTDEEIKKELEKKDEVEPKGENMNNVDEKNANNPFNIPTNPIVNDQPKVNPGFMDIDKIENEAEDIFKEEKKADLDQLLRENTKPKESVMQTPIENVEKEVEPKEPTKRFFNMFAEDLKEESADNFTKKDAPIDLEKIFNQQTTEEIKPEPKREETVDPYIEPVKKELEEYLDKKEKEENSEDIFGALINEPIENNTFPEPVKRENPFENQMNAFRLDDSDEFNKVEEVQSRNAADFKTVINTVESCTETIKNSGFKVNLVQKEINGVYQFIIEVEK